MRFPLGVSCMVLLTALLSGCGHPLERKLEGRWLGQAVENFNDRDMAAATGWAKGLLFEFAGTSLTVSIPAEEPRSGRYHVASVHHNDVRLTVDRKDQKPDTVVLKLDDEQSLRWMLGDGRSVVLRKER
jgi:hypothetical protein